MKEWHVLDGALALPEYIIEFDISPEMGKVITEFSLCAEPSRSSDSNVREGFEGGMWYPEWCTPMLRLTAHTLPQIGSKRNIALIDYDSNLASHRL